MTRIDLRKWIDRLHEAAWAALIWWIEGLRTGLPPRLQAKLFRARERILLRPDGDELRVEHLVTGAEETSRVAELTCVGELCAEELSARDVVLVLPRRARLIRRIQLPRVAAGEISRILYHEVDRLIPFAIDDCTFDYAERDNAASTESLSVDIVLARNETLETLLDNARRIGAKPTTVTAEDDQGRLIESNLLPVPRRLPVPLAPWLVRPSSLIAALAAALLALLAPLARYSTQLQAYEQTVSYRVEQAVAARVELDRSKAAVAGAEYLRTIGATYVRPLDAWLELTEVVPNDTWLSRLSISREGIELQGESSAVSTVLERIESTGHFRGAEFQTPVARHDGNGRQRFAIAASWASNE